MATFDLDSVFDDDYLHFYRNALLTDARNDAEAELIARLVGLEAGQRVLDAPCGHGRIANRLAAAGAAVTGVDRSASFLDEARRDAAARDVDVDYRHADIRDLDVVGEFDVVVDWFTSFGYHDDPTDRAILASFRRALRARGKLVLEVINRDRVLRGRYPADVPPTFTIEVGDDLMVDEVDLDATATRAVTRRTVVRDGRVRRTGFAVRLFTYAELASWLDAAGFVDLEAFGSRGEAFSWASDRLVVVATAGQAAP